MSVTEKVKVALVGCGGFSLRAQEGIVQSEMLQIVACYDPNRAAATEAAARHGATCCDSFEQALGAPGIEAVVLITPNHLHRDHAVAALAAGKHVYVEKPMANTMAECRAMIRAAEQARRLLMVGHLTRRRKSFRLLQEAVRTGRLGRPLGAEAQFSHGAGLALNPAAWRADPARCPGLPLNVIGCHLADVLNMLFGRPRTVAAFHRRAVVPTNDDCTSTLIAYDQPVTASLISHYSSGSQVHEVRVVGTAGVAEVHGNGQEFVLRLGKEVVDRQQIGEEHALAEEFAVFGRAIRHGEPLETDGLAGALVVAITEASVISAREQRFVETSELLGNL